MAMVSIEGFVTQSPFFGIIDVMVGFDTYIVKSAKIFAKNKGNTTIYILV